MESVDIKKFEGFSREELSEFAKKSREFRQRFITLEVDKIIDQKKHEEYPELLGVHHYPELKEIEFLTKEQLVQLDNEIAYNRGVHVTFHLKSDIEWDLHEKVYDFLVSKGILIKEIHLDCNCGRSSWISRSFDEKYKEQWLEDFKKSNEEYEAVGLLEKGEFEFFGYCEECEEYYEFGELTKEFIENLHFNHHYVKIKERNKQWDNI